MQSLSIYDDPSEDSRGNNVRDATSFWSLLKSKLKKLVVPRLYDLFEDFQEFILSQTDLEEITISCFDLNKFKNLVEKLPWIKRFFIGGLRGTFIFGGLPHFNLEKFAISNDDIDTKVFLFYLPKSAPTDMNAFESDFIKFVSKESLIKGVKDSEFIVSVALRHES